MAYEIQFTASARRDLLDTCHYLEEAAPEYVRHWLEGIFRTANSLREMPLRHALIAESSRVGRPLRSLRYRSHRLVYEVDDVNELVTILRIYHSARAPLQVSDLE